MNEHKTMWMVRAERGGKLFERFKEESFVAMGIQKIGSTEGRATRHEIAAQIQSYYPAWKAGKINLWAGMLHRFQNEMEAGDDVVTYDPSRRQYLVGKITGGCRYDPSFIPEDPLVRSVEWRREVSRDDLSIATKNSLGAICTLFRLPPEGVEDIERALRGERRELPE